MNPIDNILKFINGARAQGIPDEYIYRELQLAMLEATEMELVRAGISTPQRPAPATTIRNKRIGF